MKSRSILFGLSALVVAIGSAFASLPVQNPIHVRQNPSMSSTCLQVNQNLCTAAGGSSCRVKVINTAQGNQEEERIAYDASNCTTAILSDGSLITPPSPIFVSNP